MRIIKKNATDQDVTIRIVDSTDGTPEEAVEHNSAGISLWYRRQGAAKVAITPAALAALTDAHSDGGIEHIDDGYYRLDVPDAAFASGVDHVTIGGALAGMIVHGVVVQLSGVDLQDAAAMGTTDILRTGQSYTFANDNTLESEPVTITETEA